MAAPERPLSILDLLDELPATVSSRKARLFVAACCRRVWPLLVDERSRLAVAAAEDFADGRIDRPDLLGFWTEADAVWDRLGRQGGGSRGATPEMEAAGMVADGMMAFSFLESPEAQREAERGRVKAVALLSRKLAAECAARAAARPRTEALEARWAAAAAGLTDVPPLGADCDEEEFPDPRLAEEHERLRAAFEEEVRAHRPAALRAEQALQHALFDDLFASPGRAVNPAWLKWRDGAVPRLAHEIYDGPRFDRLPELADALEAAGCAEAGLLAHCREGKHHARGCWALDLLLGRE